jgi:hypothetical protein
LFSYKSNAQLTGKKWLAKIGDAGAKSQLFFVPVELLGTPSMGMN